jgi:hypothetical protein
MNMKAMNKGVEKYTLSAPMTLDELYQLMTQRWTAEMPGKFKLKKGIFGERILFDVYIQIQPRVTVKENVVTVRRMQNSTKVSVGGMPGVDIKDMKQRMAAAKEGGLKKAALGGQEYFNSVCDAMRDVLKDKTAV